MILPAKVTRPWNGGSPPNPVMADFKEAMTELGNLAARHGFVQTAMLRRELVVGSAVMQCLVTAINDSRVTPLVPIPEGPLRPEPYRFPDNTILQEFMGFPILLDSTNPTTCLVRLILPNDTIFGIDLKGVIGERPASQTEDRCGDPDLAGG